MTNNTLSLRSLLEKEKLNGTNFLDWFRNLRIVLKQERKEYVIEEPVPIEPAANAPRADKDKYKKHMDDVIDVGCLTLATMSFRSNTRTHWHMRCFKISGRFMKGKHVKRGMRDRKSTRLNSSHPSSSRMPSSA